MASGVLFLAIGTAVAAGDLVIAQFAMRARQRRLEAAPMGDDASAPSLAGIRRFRLSAVGIFLIFAALAFGLIPSAAIQPIQFH